MNTGNFSGQDGEEQGLPDRVIEGFLRVLEEVRLKDMPCSQVFTRLDEYVEREMKGEDVERLMPLLKEHLALCGDCGEEYESLMTVLKKSSGIGHGPGA